MTAGTVLNSLLGLAFYVLLARYLGVEKFGYFSYLLGLGIMAAEIGDLGFGSAMLRFGTGEKFSEIFTLTFLARGLVCVGLVLVFSFPAYIFDHQLIYGAEVGGVVLFTYLITQSLVAKQRYGWYAAGNIFGNIFRLGLLALLIFFNLLTPLAATQIYVLGLGLTSLIGLIVIRPKINLRGALALIPEAWQFNKNIALSYGMASIGAKIDIPILYTLAGPAAAGIYSSAQKLVSVLPQVAGAVEGVFATKFSDANTYRQYFYEYLRVVTILCIGVLGAMLFAPIIVPLFFGNKYLDSIGVFQVLLFGIVFFFFSGPPAAAILYRYSKPSCHLFNSALGLGVSLVAYFILIPSLGPTGAGWAFVIASAVVMVANYLWLKFIR